MLLRSCKQLFGPSPPKDASWSVAPEPLGLGGAAAAGGPWEGARPPSVLGALHDDVVDRVSAPAGVLPRPAPVRASCACDRALAGPLVRPPLRAVRTANRPSCARACWRRGRPRHPRPGASTLDPHPSRLRPQVLAALSAGELLAAGLVCGRLKALAVRRAGRGGCGARACGVAGGACGCDR